MDVIGQYILHAEVIWTSVFSITVLYAWGMVLVACFLVFMKSTFGFTDKGTVSLFTM